MKHNWTYKKLGEVVKCYRGLTYSKADEVPVSSKMVLRSNNIDLDTHALNFDEIKCVREDLPIADDRKLKKDSIFICMSNGSMQHLGKVAYVDKDYDYAFGGFMGLIVPDPKEVFPKYVYYSLLAPNFLATVLREGRGANINNLRFTDLENYSLPMPAKDEQKSIVQELDGINRLIDLQEEQLREYDRLAQSLFYSTFGDPATNPKGWEVKKLGEVAEQLFAGGDVPKNDLSQERDENHPYPIYSNGVVQEGLYGYTGSARVSEPALTISARGTIGVVFKRNEPFFPVVRLLVLVPKKEVLGMDYTMYCLRTFNIENNGVAIPQLTVPMLKQYAIPVPPLALQQSFAAQIEAIEQQKALIRRSLDDTRTLLAARMQYYFE